MQHSTRATWGDSCGVAQADEFVCEELRLDMRQRLLRHALRCSPGIVCAPVPNPDPHFGTQQGVSATSRQAQHGRLERHACQPLVDTGLRVLAGVGGCTWGASARRRMSIVSARVVRSLSRSQTFHLPFVIGPMAYLLHGRKAKEPIHGGLLHTTIKQHPESGRLLLCHAICRMYSAGNQETTRHVA